MSWESERERQARLYEEHLGRTARVRQEDLLGTRHGCCGEHIDEPHHVMCRNYVEPTVPAVHPDQGTLS